MQIKTSLEAVPPDGPSRSVAEEQIQQPLPLIWEAILEKDWKQCEEVLRKQVPAFLLEQWNSANLSAYNPILFLDQSNPIGEEHADRIYSALCAFNAKSDIMLVIGSRGGRIEPAYLISKNCKAAASSKFIAVVPRRAKSAATLAVLGADEIHMGSMSELGPIDPQLGRLPALSLTNALQTVARLVTEYPKSGDMFAKYLQSQLDLGMLGYFERINESAVQYAVRLLQGKKLPDNRTAQSLASHLVNHYKDHSFVIDKDEAITLFGSDTLKVQTPEYTFANNVDQQLRLFSRVAKIVHNKVVTFVGGFEDCIKVRDLSKDEE